MTLTFDSKHGCGLWSLPDGVLIEADLENGLPLAGEGEACCCSATGARFTASSTTGQGQGRKHTHTITTVYDNIEQATIPCNITLKL